MVSETVASAGAVRTARLIGLCGSGLLRLLGATWRVRVIGDEWEAECRAAGKGFVLAFWHGRLLPFTQLCSGRGCVALVSHSRDGEYIAQTLRRMGFRVIRGSSSRGGPRALLAMARAGSDGGCLAITPDGPRGPRERVQRGAILVAQRAGIPILPSAVSAWPRKRLSSWDRLMIPLPFARLVWVFGRPIRIPGDCTPDEAVARWSRPVENALNEVTARSDREVQRWAGRNDGEDLP